MANNIETFDTAVADILAYLYGTFPRLVVLDAHGLSETQDQETRDVYFGTVMFLQREGFLTYHTRAGNGGKFSSVVLTARGLELLRAMPASLRATKPLGDQLRDAVKEVAKGIAKQVVQAATSPEAWHLLTRTPSI